MTSKKHLKMYDGPSTVRPDKRVMLRVMNLKTPSKNRKTGPMVQVGGILADVHPVEATKTGCDEALCGGCRLRPKLHAEDKAKGIEVSKYPCYVKVRYKQAQRQAGLNQPTTYEEGLEALRGRDVRFGEYSNMSSFPRERVEPMFYAVSESGGNHTCYEHEWRKPENQWLAKWSMASVHSAEERAEAKALGWRTFRIGESKLPGETLCPYETPKKVQCIKCKMCSGNQVNMRDVYIPSHV